MAEPTKLPSAEEFNFMLSSVARDHAYALALAWIAKLVAERDAWGSAWLPPIERERDALAAELVELRGRTIQHILDLVPHSPHCNGGRTFYLCGKCDVTERINKEFAAQPQGERGAQFMAVVKAARRHADMVSRACEEDSPIEYSDYENFAFELLQMFAAIDGVQP